MGSLSNVDNDVDKSSTTDAILYKPAGSNLWIETSLSNINAGGSDKNYVHTQEQASKEWTITHNLGKYPAVSVVDSAGTEVEGEVHYVDLNKVKLIFSAEFSGKATLN